MPDGVPPRAMPELPAERTIPEADEELRIADLEDPPMMISDMDDERRRLEFEAAR